MFWTNISRKMDVCENSRSPFPSGALGALENWSIFKGSEKGRDRGSEKGPFGKKISIKLIHFPNNLENLVFLKKSGWGGCTYQQEGWGLTGR